MASLNKIMIIGRLGQDPDVRQFPNGGSVTHINVATSERWTDKQTGQPKEQTEWHRVSLFNRLGEIAAQYLRKGSSVYIEGSLHTRKWTDQQGIERYATEIKAQSMQMLGGNPAQGGQSRDNFAGGYGQPYQEPPQEQHWQNTNHFNQPATQPLAQPQPHTTMPMGQPEGNQFMNSQPAPPQGSPKAITPPASNISDDDMPF